MQHDSGPESIAIVAAGHALGGGSACNREAARSLGLPEDWICSRTGIESRSICLQGEDADSLALLAIQRALGFAGLNHSDLGPETVLIYTHNSIREGSPPAAVGLCNKAGLRHCRGLTLDGVCAEPVNAVEVALGLFARGRCNRALIVASADYDPIINPADSGTVGLFGSGAGVLILEHGPWQPGYRIGPVSWYNDNSHAGLGRLTMRLHEKQAGGISVDCSYYEMDGMELAQLLLRSLPSLVEQHLADCGWRSSDVDLVISHQPNAKLLGLLRDRMGFSETQLPAFCMRIGNLGPATVPYGYSLLLGAASSAQAAANGAVEAVRPRRVLLLAFGLGFACGIVSLEAC